MERRNFERFSCIQQPCEVRIGDEVHSAYIVEKSINGMKIEGFDPLVIPRGAPLIVQTQHLNQECFCQSISRSETGAIQLGVSLQEVGQNDGSNTQLLLACFVGFRSSFFQCQPISVVSPGKLQVELWNEESMVVGRPELRCMTQFERKKEIVDAPEQLDFLQHIYQLSPSSNLDSVIEFEFGS